MATAGRPLYGRKWPIDDLYTVAVCNENPENTDAKVILECFVTDRSNVEIKFDVRSGKCYFQVPIPWQHQPGSSAAMKKTLRNLIGKYVYKEHNVIAVSIDDLKSWEKSKFCKTLLEAFCYCSKLQAERKPYPVKLLFCSLDKKNFDTAVEACEHVMNAHSKSENKRQQGPTIEIEEGNLAKIKADVITCTMSSSFDLSKGGASNALLKCAGNELQHELQRNYSRGLDYRQIAILHGYRLKCEFVYFGVMGPWSKVLNQTYVNEEHHCRASIHDFMKLCLDDANQRRCKSIAFPAIGTGNLQYPLGVVADEMFETANNWIADNKKCHLEKITFVLHPDNNEAKQAFRFAEKEADPKKSRASSQSSSGHNTVKTSEFRITYPHPRSSHKKVEIKVPIPSGYPMDFVQMCCEKTINACKKSECDVSFSKDEITVKGPEGIAGLAKAKIENAIEDMKKEYPSQGTLDVGQSNLDSSYIMKKFEDIKKLFNVNCTMNNLKNVQFFGQRIQDVAKAKDWLANLFSSSNSKTDLDSTKGMQESAVRPKQRGIGRQFSWSTSTRALQLFETKEKIVVKVYSADILTAPVDCIVNAANFNLQHDGGIALAIAKAAGKDLVKEGHDFLKNHGKLRVGEACCTGAGKMPFDCVIHAVGPCWSDYQPYSMGDVDKCETDLYNAIINSLAIAEKRNLKMIAVSSISSGKYGCPLDLCSVQYAKAVLAYSGQLSCSPLKEIHFVDTNMEMVKTIQETFQTMIPGDKVPKSYNKLKYVKFHGAANESYKGRRTSQHTRTDELHLSMNAQDTSEKWSKSARAASSKSGMVIYPFCHSDVPPGQTKKKTFACCFGVGQNLSIYTGDILSVINIDMVVCGNILSGNTEGKLAKAISKKGGKPYEIDKKAAFKKGVQPGDVVVCKSGNMNDIKWVAHAILYRKVNSKDANERMHKVNSVFTKIFDTFKDTHCHTLAIPLIGTGKGNSDPEYCAERFMDSLMHFCSFNKSFRFRILLINKEKDKTETAVEVAKKVVRDSSPLSIVTKHSNTSISYPGERTPARPDTAGKSTRSQQNYDKGNRGGNARGGRSLIEKTREGSWNSESQARINSNTGKGSYERNETPEWKKRGERNEHRKAANSYGAGNWDELENDYNSFEELQLNDKEDMTKGKSLSDAGTDDDDHPSKEPSKNEEKDVEKKPGNLPIYHEGTSRDGEKELVNSEEGEDNSEEEEEEKEEEDVSEETYSKESDNERDPDDTNVEEEADTCVICMDDVTDPKVLPCGHVFCTECIDAQFAYKKVCPTCGKVCGIITGDQPEGDMHVRKNERASCAGYEDCGRIEITYKFPDGTQGANHPSPGTRYKGITRTAYLPDNKRGREICEMLKIAYDRKLVFTIGSSRTTGAEGVITWNDIHHKTDNKPNTQFGYPDPTYLDRVTEELEIKGVTLNDIPTLSEPRHRRR